MNEALLKKDLEIITRITKQLNIRFFLDGGTLLGAIRDKHIISYDSDFDFGVFRTEFPIGVIQNLKIKLVNGGFYFKRFGDKYESSSEHPHMIKFTSHYARWNTDFFIFEQREKDYYHKGWNGYFYFLKETLDTLDEIEFLGFKLLVPHNPELYLEHLYGKDWKTPKHMDKPKDYPNFKAELI